MRHNSKSWTRLDNAAKIYPAAQSKKWSALFRMSATLTEPVDPVILDMALERVRHRMPVFFMQLQKGAFWYYLEQRDGKPEITPDISYPCEHMNLKKNGGFSFRVRYYKNRISVEFFHVLTDGTGGLCFLKTLVAEYLSIKYGADIPRSTEILDCDAPPADEEMEDSFFKHVGPASVSRSESNSYPIKGEENPCGFVDLTQGTMPADAVKKKSNEYGASVTEFLTAVMVESIIHLQESDGIRRMNRKAVKICVPVNLRKTFNSTTLRNFASYVNIGVDPRLGDYSFEELISAVHHQMGTETSRQQLNAKFTANVRSEQNLALRIAPLFLKNFVMKMAYMSVGDRKTSTIISNLGVVRLPDEMKQYVDHVEFILGPLCVNPVACSVLTYDGTMYFNITRTIREPKLEREFFTRLVKLGIPVKINSNQRKDVE